MLKCKSKCFSRQCEIHHTHRYFIPLLTLKAIIYISILHVTLKASDLNNTEARTQIHVTQSILCVISAVPLCDTMNPNILLIFLILQMPLLPESEKTRKNIAEKQDQLKAKCLVPSLEALSSLRGAN